MFDFRQALTYVFDDPDWPAILAVGGFLSIIPFVGLLVQIYFYPTLRNTVLGQPDVPLADWPGGGKFLARVFRSFVIGLVICFVAIPLASRRVPGTPP